MHHGRNNPLQLTQLSGLKEKAVGEARAQNDIHRGVVGHVVGNLSEGWPPPPQLMDGAGMDGRYAAADDAHRVAAGKDRCIAVADVGTGRSLPLHKDLDLGLLTAEQSADGGQT